MRNLSILAAGAMLLGLWSCTNDDGPTKGKFQDTEGDIFAKLTLSLPQSRAATTTEEGDDVPATSDNGTEVGQDYENNVNNIAVILASYDAPTNTYRFIASSFTSDILDQSQTVPTYSIQFQSDELLSYANEGNSEATMDEKPIYVFAYANPDDGLLQTLMDLNPGDSFSDLTAKLNEADKDNIPWASKNNFTMTNALLTVAYLPNYQELISKHNSKATALDLGVVKVERMVSRFDFMGNPANAVTGLPANTYNITDNVSGLPVANVELQALALFNEANEFYYLPRMTSNSNWGVQADIKLCGYELPTSYVVSPNYTGKANFAKAVAAANNNQTALRTAYDAIKENYYYNNDLTTSELNFTEFSSLTENDYDGWVDANGTDYKIWRYATENTLPQGGSWDAQLSGISTGIAFRGEIKALSEREVPTPEDGSYHPAVSLRNAMQAGETLYAFSLDGKVENNVMLGSAKDVWKYSYQHATSDIRTQFMAAVAAGQFTVLVNGTQATTEDAIFPEITVENPFEQIEASVTITGFTSNNKGLTADNRFIAYSPVMVNGVNHYYVYYRYFNRHNDNSKLDIMGRTEFATVRNNIYKLRVNTVSAFGTPGDFPPKVDNPDENPDVFFKVTVSVIDWVVRVNDIVLKKGR